MTNTQRRQNLRLALILAGVAVSFACVFVLKLVWLRS
jgi:hypothetical protein